MFHYPLLSHSKNLIYLVLNCLGLAFIVKTSSIMFFFQSGPAVRLEITLTSLSPAPRLTHPVSRYYNYENVTTEEDASPTIEVCYKKTTLKMCSGDDTVVRCFEYFI